MTASVTVTANVTASVAAPNHQNATTATREAQARDRKPYETSRKHDPTASARIKQLEGIESAAVIERKPMASPAPAGTAVRKEKCMFRNLENRVTARLCVFRRGVCDTGGGGAFTSNVGKGGVGVFGPVKTCNRGAMTNGSPAGNRGGGGFGWDWSNGAASAT